MTGAAQLHPPPPPQPPPPQPEGGVGAVIVIVFAQGVADEDTPHDVTITDAPLIPEEVYVFVIEAVVPVKLSVPDHR
jgi:hypothetical protein